MISVEKRNGAGVQPFVLKKIVTAIKAAFKEARQAVGDNRLSDIADMVERKVALRSEGSITVEEIQDLVETTLMEVKYPAVAKAYILYRSKREGIRASRLHPDKNAISNYIHLAKYSRYLPEKKRRETFLESVARVEKMHTDKFPDFASDISEAMDFVRDKKILPSMRNLQFAGKAIETTNTRSFNCAFMLVDRQKAFRDTLYLLLCGTGVGFSVQYEHVDKLLSLKHVDSKNVVHYTIPDTIEGWATSVDKLLHSFVKGYYIEFNYSKIRDSGTPLKTSGGNAPGHLGLKKALDNVRTVLVGAQGRKMRPIECYDVLCHIADAVLSGGIRRSSMICLFSMEDGEMLAAKTGNWFDRSPWRANSNNSVVMVKGEATKRQYNHVFKHIREFGDPGFVFLPNRSVGYNPCSEAGLNPMLDITEKMLATIEAKRQAGAQIPKVKLGDSLSGIGWCNLCEIDASKFTSLEDMVAAATMAARLGTLQAAYTSMPFVGWVAEMVCEREALLGVGMTGMKDAPGFAMDPEYQTAAAKAAVVENQRVARILGINAAARVTVVKPAGTSSLLLGGVGSGIHEHHARRYFRRVTANENEPVFQYFKSVNPSMCVKKPNGDWVIEFPVEAPPGAALKEETSAIEFLKGVQLTQANWIKHGLAIPESSPGLSHNVSNTVVVRPEEWAEVAEYVWNNQDSFGGVSFLPSTGDKDFAFAPMEAVTTEADEEKWNFYLKHYKPVDYSKMVEGEDNTDLAGEAACSGGSCEIV